MAIITKPVTGKEAFSDVQSPIQSLEQFYYAFNNKEIEVMSLNWDQSDEISMDNPLGGIKRGWNEISEVYEKIFNGPAKVYVEFYDYTIHETEDVFYAVGRERGTFSTKDITLDLQIRTSRIFKKVNGMWKQVHHHGSIESPELLKKYQDTLLSKK